MKSHSLRLLIALCFISIGLNAQTSQTSKQIKEIVSNVKDGFKKFRGSLNSDASGSVTNRYFPNISIEGTESSIISISKSTPAEYSFFILINTKIAKASIEQLLEKWKTMLIGTLGKEFTLNPSTLDAGYDFMNKKGTRVSITYPDTDPTELRLEIANY